MKKIALTAILLLSVVFTLFATGVKEEQKGDVVINYYGRPEPLENTIIANFEAENPDIKINYVELPSSSNDRLKTIQTVLQAGGSEMDVFAGDACWPAIFVSAGWVEPMDSYVNADVFNSYLDTMLAAYKMNGKTYGLPFMADVCALYYRADLLEKYGYEVPTSFDEIINISKTIMAKEGNSDLYGWGSIWMQNESLTCCFLNFYWLLGGEIVDENGKNVFDQAKAEQALKMMWDMINTHKISPEGMGVFSTNDMRNMVKAGNLIFSEDWLSGYANYNNAESSKVAGNMMIAALPDNGALGGWGVMVSKFSKNKEAAMKFAQYRASYEAQKTALEIGKIVPTIKSLYEETTSLVGYEYLNDFLAPLSVAKPRGLTPYYAEVSSKIQIETNAVVTNMKTPSEAAASMTNAIAKIF